MAERFLGEIYLKVDAKARVLIPADFRAILKDDDPSSPDPARPRMHMVYGGPMRAFVECYSKRAFEQLAADIESMDEGDERDDAELNLLTRSVKVEVEPDGRIVLPPRVREKLGLLGDETGEKAEVVFAGKSDRFHIYRRDIYEARFGNIAQVDKPDAPDPRKLVSMFKRRG
ncbi:division/cell wall cluster transcriptional repressor MraZ [Rhodobacter calidifons]|uniref:Transcriptional regulator MraZ n=1 Tax=Rhodobacter calidifons TaxID=2715277 RepID=A0ABX0G7M7_9RHOB|nr:division/cell wall cluster transcriptional repressor MraZ [Rhodobacter calidifons]NHB77134.1 division/cell wall cluster transcriptional repressor MraZ [Rhodobacter calidifons]